MLNYFCQDCGHPALYHCQCSPEQFICASHLHEHITSPGDHSAQAIFQTLTREHEEEACATVSLLGKAVQTVVSRQFERTHQEIQLLLQEIRIQHETCSQAISKHRLAYQQALKELKQVKEHGWDKMQHGPLEQNTPFITWIIETIEDEELRTTLDALSDTTRIAARPVSQLVRHHTQVVAKRPKAELGGKVPQKPTEDTSIIKLPEKPETKKKGPFQLSEAALAALDTLSNTEERLLYPTHLGQPDIIACFQLYFVFLKRKVPDSQSLPVHASLYMMNAKRVEGGMISSLRKDISRINFEDVDYFLAIQEATTNLRYLLNPTNFQASSPIASCMSTLLREIAIHAGLLDTSAHKDRGSVLIQSQRSFKEKK